MDSKKTYMIRQGNLEDYRMISQKGVRQAIVSTRTHNACWDSNLSPDGRLYFSLCSEYCMSEYAKLCEYDYDKNEIRECFYVKDVILPQDRYIRDSKFHTCISFLDDGDLLMVTHTTDKAPQQPTWIPKSYYSNPWEGYQGGVLIRYNPRKGEVINLGIPAPRETIYGAAYDPKRNCYYMLGYMRGHLYRYDLDAKRAVDMGQVSEYGSYRITMASDGNLYFSTRSGFLMRINTDKQIVEDTGVRLPDARKKYRWPYSYYSVGRTGPDGRLYISGQYSTHFSAYDPKSGKLEVIGPFKDADEYVDKDIQHALAAGMDFDADGVLWYVISSMRDNEDDYYKVPATLMRWDITRGGKPESLGIMGTPERAVGMTNGVHIDKKRDILYVVATNHSNEGPDVTAIDLKEFRKHMYEKGEICRDKFMFAPGAPEYKEYGDIWHEQKRLSAAYTANFKCRKVTPIRLWKELPYQQIEETKVIGLAWDDENKLHGLCGNKERYCFKVEDGKLTSFEPLSEKPDKYKNWLLSNILPKKPEKFDGLPYYPGRPFLAEAVASCPWNNRRTLVATKDGMLALVSSDGVYSLGPATSHGIVRCLTTNSDCTLAYGVGGDPDDLGNVFRYDDKCGLVWLGHMFVDSPDNDCGTAANYVLTSCVLDRTGKVLAIGAGDRLSYIYLCEVSE